MRWQQAEDSDTDFTLYTEGGSALCCLYWSYKNRWECQLDAELFDHEYLHQTIQFSEKQSVEVRKWVEQMVERALKEQVNLWETLLARANKVLSEIGNTITQ